MVSELQVDLSRHVRTVWEDNLQLEETTLPYCLVAAWYSTIPLLKIEYALCVLAWTSYEAKRMILAP